MPTAYLKKLAEEGHGSVAELEKKWDEAKAQAAKAGQADNFAYVTSIFNRMAHIKGHIMKINASQRLRAFAPQGTNQVSPQAGIKQGPILTTSGDNAYLDKLVETGQFTREQVDDAWEKAKQTANKNAKENPDIVQSYAYTTAIFQDILGIKDRDPSSPAEASITKPFGVAAAARLRIMASFEPDFNNMGTEAKVKAMLKGIGCRIKSKVFFEDDKGDPRSISGEYKIEPMDVDELKDNVEAYFYEAKLKGNSGKKCWWEIEGNGIMMELEYDGAGKINFNVTEP
jgi:hypothetical protein